MKELIVINIPSLLEGIDFEQIEKDVKNMTEEEVNDIKNKVKEALLNASKDSL